jgi:hypothetical protein
MEESAEPLSTGLRPEKAKCSDLMYYERPRNKFSLFVTI